MHGVRKPGRRKGLWEALEGAPFVQATARYSMRLEWQVDREVDPR